MFCNIAIVHYPHALKSAVFGMAELIDMANEVASTLVGQSTEQQAKFATCHILDPLNLSQANCEKRFDYILIPPAASSSLDTSRLDRVRNSNEIANWLLLQHNTGAIIAASCIGVHLLAQTGLLDDCCATTHWGVADEMQREFPSVKFDSNAILMDNGITITAGGLMAWVDLMLCVVQRVYGPKTMSLLAKQMLVDTGYRQQQHYKQFIPNNNHGDNAIEHAQRFIDANLSQPITIESLCQQAHLTERTLQRRFQQYFGLSPTEYLQRSRVQYACQQLELSNSPVKEIAYNAGYLEINAFRKIFQRITGLTPSAYRKQFMPVFIR